MRWRKHYGYFLLFSMVNYFRSRGYKKIAEHEFFLLINVEMPTFVGIPTLMSRKNSIIGLSEPDKSYFS